MSKTKKISKKEKKYSKRNICPKIKDKKKEIKIPHIVTVISKNEEGYLSKKEIDFNNRQTFTKIKDDNIKKLLYKLSEKPIIKKKIIIHK